MSKITLGILDSASRHRCDCCWAAIPVQIKWVAVRDMSKPRAVDLPAVRLTDDWEVVNDPEVEIIVEVAGGILLSTSWYQLGEARKQIVTANKELIKNMARRY
jgi:homoserine dehydrogenase